MKKKRLVNKEPSAARDQQRMRREYSGDRIRCRVTFRPPGEAAPGATSVAVAGSFNDWSVGRFPVQRSKEGDFALEMELEAGEEQAFRSLIDGVRRESVWNADKYAWCDHAQCTTP